MYLCIFLHSMLPCLRSQVINTGPSPGLKEPIDCADSNDCFCNEMILTAQIDHLWLRVIKLVSSEHRSHNRMRKPFWADIHVYCIMYIDHSHQCYLTMRRTPVDHAGHKSIVRPFAYLGENIDIRWIFVLFYECRIKDCSLNDAKSTWSLALRPHQPFLVLRVQAAQSGVVSHLEII